MAQRLAKRVRLVIVAAVLASTSCLSFAQVQPESFSYPVGLNPNGDNFLALRSLPSTSEGVRLAKLGPDTLFAEIGRLGEWVHVRLPSGDTGWVSARFVGCCRTAAIASPVPYATPGPSCGDLWYRRNAIYKAAGYCFKTARGIDAFGNAGCQYDDVADVPLSARQRDGVADLQREEASLGCPR